MGNVIALNMIKGIGREFIVPVLSHIPLCIGTRRPPVTTAMMRFHHILSFCAAALQCCNAINSGHASELVMQDERHERDPLQNIVTWDAKSLFIHGERVMVWSGEVQPFRLPVPTLWIDVFEKVKALGFNAVSFYVYWALLEPKQGSFRADGIFDLKPFFKAATDAGIYLIARPGPYINAEVAGGGFPGWLQRVNATLRTSAPEFLAAVDKYKPW